jgi:hypothetical protein
MTIDGLLSVKLPPGTQPNHKLLLRNKGVKTVAANRGAGRLFYDRNNSSVSTASVIFVLAMNDYVIYDIKPARVFGCST